MNILVAEIGYCVHMSDEADRGLVLISGSGRKLSVEIALVVQHYVCKPQAFHLILQKACQVKLALGGRNRLAVFITWCTYNNVL